MAIRQLRQPLGCGSTTLHEFIQQVDCLLGISDSHFRFDKRYRQFRSPLR